MCERKAFYIQASFLCPEAISHRDSAQPAENITNYQVPLSHYEQRSKTTGYVCVQSLRRLPWRVRRSLTAVSITCWSRSQWRHVERTLHGKGSTYGGQFWQHFTQH